MIRPATLSDLHEIMGMARDEAQRYPELKTDLKKIHDGIVMAISSAKHFCWVSVDENDAGNTARGVIVGVSSTNLWAQRQNCIVALWKSEIVGDGRKLMKEFMEWVKGRRIIRVSGIVPDNNDVDPRAWSLMERLGFEKQGGAYLLYN